MADSAEFDAGDGDEQECGYVYDHDTETVYDGPDGHQWICRRCGAEGWEDPEPTSVTSPGVQDSNP